jgi:hypothetical protein
MRKIGVFFVIFFIIGYAFSDEIGNFSFFGADIFDPFYEFDGSKINFNPYRVGIIGVGTTETDIEINTTYKYSIINGIYYLTINYMPEIKTILLYNDDFGYMSIYSPLQAESGLLIRHDLPNKIGINKHSVWHNFYDIKISTSSFLIENDIEYSGNNLLMSIKDGPWVEGVSGDGIGEYIELDYSESYLNEINGIVISNGFVSENNPDLYIKNNRVKRILIEGDNGRFRNEYDILDTANLQTIRFPINVSKIKITILDIYKGTTWDDTCINMIIGIKI